MASACAPGGGGRKLSQRRPRQQEEKRRKEVPPRPVAGLYELEMRRRLLQEQLGVVNDKYDKVDNLLRRKEAKRKGVLSLKQTARVRDQMKASAAEADRLRQEENGEARARGGNQYDDSCSYGVGRESTRSRSQSTLQPRQRRGGQDRGISLKKAANLRRRSLRESKLPPLTALPMTLAKPKPTEPGGCVDFMRKKNLLKTTATQIERDQRKEGRAEAERNRFKTQEHLQEQEVARSTFPMRYSRGEVPAGVEHSGGSSNSLVWVCPLQQLDYEHYLPMFVDGIREKENPIKFIAQQGTLDLLEAARGSPERILPSLKEVVSSLRTALMTKRMDLVIFVVDVLERLATNSPKVGEAMVGLYRLFLGALNLFIDQTRNIGDRMDYKQLQGGDAGEKVMWLLQVLERTGGKDAFANIKYSVPTYESCQQ